MPHTSDERAIRQRIEELAEAIRKKDLDGAMSNYALDIVSFDIEPPLRHHGAEAKRRNWAHAFSMYDGELAYEIRELYVTAASDLAFAYSIYRTDGTSKSGNIITRWLRSTLCLRKINGEWLIVHDHISAPLDLQSGKALPSLEP